MQFGCSHSDTFPEHYIIDVRDVLMLQRAEEELRAALCIVWQFNLWEWMT